MAEDDKKKKTVKGIYKADGSQTADKLKEILETPPAADKPVVKKKKVIGKTFTTTKSVTEAEREADLEAEAAKYRDKPKSTGGPGTAVKPKPKAKPVEVGTQASNKKKEAKLRKKLYG